AKDGDHGSRTSRGGLTPLKASYPLRSGALYMSRHGTTWQRPLAWLAYLTCTKWLVTRSLIRGDTRSAKSLLLGFFDFTWILLGFRPPARTPESFAPPAPRR